MQLKRDGQRNLATLISPKLAHAHPSRLSTNPRRESSGASAKCRKNWRRGWESNPRIKVCRPCIKPPNCFGINPLLI